MIRALAARQHGVVARGQLLEAGVAVHGIDYRVRSGGLHVLHRGVYRVGPIAARLEREMAAVLACGSDAVVSHGSAALLWQLHFRPTLESPVELSTPRGYRVRSAALHVHRIPGLAPDEKTEYEGVPITTPRRTLLDLAGTVTLGELEQALARAERQRLTTPAELGVLLARHPRRPGAPALRALLGQASGPLLTRSEGEALLLKHVRAAELPEPETNVVLHGYEVDFLWRTERLVVEVDGYAFHSSPRAFERDRRRDAVLTAAGLHVLRFTWRALTQAPMTVVARIAGLLGPGERD